MDRSLYVAMTGAAQVMRAQAEVSHNLANVSTVGFRAQLGTFDSLPVRGEGLATRVNVVDRPLGADFSTGPQMSSGRDLDVAIQGEGWIAVQARDGGEGYTRAGDLSISAEGQLLTGSGLPVLGDSGPITIPPYSKLDIGNDGTISVVPQGQGPETVSAVGRIKLVNPDKTLLVRGGDGLMRLANGSETPADAAVHLVSGVIEGSNVNPTEALTRMISLSRQFEMQVRAIKAADENAQAATRLLSR